MSAEVSGSHPSPLVIIVMGVSACGKSTVAQALADGWSASSASGREIRQTGAARLLDADDLHPPSNKAKMGAGIPLSDRDRAPWLAALRAKILEHVTEQRFRSQANPSSVHSSDQTSADNNANIIHDDSHNESNDSDAAKAPETLILACSALRQLYRKVLAEGPDAHTGASTAPSIAFVHLQAPFEVFDARIRDRTGHFMPASLLQSQFALLEDPTLDSPREYQVLAVDARQSLDTIQIFVMA
ncbi:gluconokinase [Capsaspora owczarzaki ATCC 30864]|uniref:gluconokinase n=1 Tax=Capsaspora owczarzaki (strain ATCC 30864) TaxID=595528 RepID=A0A0D2WNP7_CAPO3|nr:gluconokinase [Capsaspora owczarzaki ATCC 30864]KJE92820.1 gluconokinase [Capsaspora owczarzaki ATCC 30864]|eukprot:XP_004363447.2 gluconokinase [Capsaspora owczarzaki ATCC 30864]